MFRVMFVCTGNTCRSPMAAGGLEILLENNGVKTVGVCSSGTVAASGYPATAYAIEAARIWDADISLHSSQPLTENLIEESDLIICMAPSHCREVTTIVPEAVDKTFLLKNYPEPGCDGEGVEDPIGGSLDMYNRTFLEIGEELGRILPYILKATESKAGDDES